MHFASISFHYWFFVPLPILCSSSPLKKSLVLCSSSPPPMSLSFFSLYIFVCLYYGIDFYHYFFCIFSPLLCHRCFSLEDFLLPFKTHIQETILSLSLVTSQETNLVARCRRVYGHAHDYHINSISNNRQEDQ
ncbi:uncharacterized protein [Gossypium hirsutum]|uniref:Uncharacterized protein n=2 Tax=Gossypium TaxID=3633 RepID=A0A1U8NPA0_GOSHI|nr:uncharacterized protein LOC107949671 [Gossypium hirsutum]TYH80476.1 hypothetical protein ES332_D03G134700v1 [Gossypium tomentosum]